MLASLISNIFYILIQIEECKEANMKKYDLRFAALELERRRVWSYNMRQHTWLKERTMLYFVIRAVFAISIFELLKMFDHM